MIRPICATLLRAIAIAPLLVGGVAHASSKNVTVRDKANPSTGAKCALDYATFEASIPHIDLENCPGGEASDKVFCRAKTGHDEIVIFKFSAQGGQCLVSTKSYDSEHFNLTIFDLVVGAD